MDILVRKGKAFRHRYVLNKAEFNSQKVLAVGAVAGGAQETSYTLGLGGSRTTDISNRCRVFLFFPFYFFSPEHSLS